jgi:carbon storage regulator
MLKITRRAGERIIVGDDIVVTLLEVSGSTARIGIEAPAAVPIFREEIWVEVKRENEAAARAADELAALSPDAGAPGVQPVAQQPSADAHAPAETRT